jgi:hypothetical protein
MTVIVSNAQIKTYPRKQVFKKEQGRFIIKRFLSERHR